MFLYYFLLLYCFTKQINIYIKQHNITKIIFIQEALNLGESFVLQGLSILSVVQFFYYFSIMFFACSLNIIYSSSFRIC